MNAWWGPALGLLVAKAPVIPIPIILESNDSSSSGILSHNSATYTFDGENEFLYYGASCNPEINKNSNQKYIKIIIF